MGGNGREFPSCKLLRTGKQLAGRMGPDREYLHVVNPSGTADRIIPSYHESLRVVDYDTKRMTNTCR